MRTLLSTASIALVISVMAIPAPAPAAAQEIKFKKKTNVELGGTLGDLMRTVGGGPGEQEEEVLISVPAKLMRTNRDDKSTIVNYTTGDVISLDHDENTWMTMNIGRMMEGMGTGVPGGQTPPQYQQPPQSEEEPAYEARFSVDVTDDSKDILGYRARLTILRVDLVPVRAPEGQSLDEMPTHVMVTAMWLADDFVGNEAMRTLTAEFGEQMRNDRTEGLGQAVAANPALRQAFEENGEKLAGMDGMPLEQTIAFTSLPPGVEFDLREALGGDLAESGAGDFLAGVAKDAASSELERAAQSGLGRANRAVGGRLGGLMGRRRQQAEPEPEPAKQFVLIRIHERLTSFNEGGFPTGWNLVPDDYTERQSPFPIRK